MFVKLFSMVHSAIQKAYPYSFSQSTFVFEFSLFFYNVVFLDKIKTNNSMDREPYRIKMFHLLLYFRLHSFYWNRTFCKRIVCKRIVFIFLLKWEKKWVRIKWTIKMACCRKRQWRYTESYSYADAICKHCTMDTVPSNENIVHRTVYCLDKMLS